VGKLETELKKIRRCKLIIIDEVGYISFEDAASLFFQLIASRYEQGSVMVTSDLPFGCWDKTSSDDIGAAAMIDRLVHAEVLTLTDGPYRTRQRRELLAKDKNKNQEPTQRVKLPEPPGVSFREPLTTDRPITGGRRG
jgi:DNA replication protein DnaC